MVNLSSKELSNREVLRRGLNFAPTPQRIPYVDVIASVENAARKLQNSEAENLRGRPNHSHPTGQNQLQESTDIVILSADKGSATVVMDRSPYT